MASIFKDVPTDFPGIIALAQASIKEIESGIVQNREDTATACLHAALLKYFPGSGEKLKEAKAPIDWLRIAELLDYSVGATELSTIYTELELRIEAVALTSFSLEDGGRIPDEDGNTTLRLCRIITSMDTSKN